MFYSENLLAKEGPLAQVWLAANLERKLSKHQFLQSNITNSTQAIMKATTENDDSEALALRLSGQLLYGVVRIYSRKAKYLLDDVSDALLKLKSAFKSNSSTVTLPVNATIVPSVNQLILQDTITQSDLLYQEPLTFDDENVSGPSYADFFGNTQGATTNQDFDESIEIPRNRFDELDDLQNADDDLELDLNFDLDEPTENAKGNNTDANLEFDDSIEAVRAADDANLSAILANRSDDDGGYADFDYAPMEDLGYDLEPVEEVNENEQNEATTPTPELLPKPKKQRKQRVSTAGQRKIVNDREIEIPVSNFNNTDGIVITNEDQDVPDLNAKRAYIDFLLRDDFLQNDITQKLLDTKRQRTVASPPSTDDVPELEDSEVEIFNNGDNEDYEIDQGGDFDFDFADEDFDKVPMNPDEQDQDVIEEQTAYDENVNEQILDDFNSSGSKDGISESTIKISAHLRNVFETKEVADFSEVIEKDTNEGTPLSSFPKSEATRVFFELLVLGTADAVKLQQNELFGEIQIQSKPNLFDRFL